jgi:hypothetical protein
LLKKLFSVLESSEVWPGWQWMSSRGLIVGWPWVTRMWYIGRLVRCRNNSVMANAKISYVLENGCTWELPNSVQAFRNRGKCKEMTIHCFICLVPRAAISNIGPQITEGQHVINEGSLGLATVQNGTIVKMSTRSDLCDCHWLVAKKRPEVKFV